MTELILLVGILVLFVLHMQLRSRFAQLEQHVFPTLEPRHEAAAPPDPIPPREMAAWLARPPEPSVSVSDMPGEEAPEAESGEQEEAPAPARETLAMLFERFVGGRLLIWIGGLALAVAGILLVRYSIQHSFATPPVRMAMAAVFGFLLLAAGEYARSRPDSALDPRIGQALVGAGILVLYATPYGALMLYQLISNSTATVLMVMVTAVALVLSLRHGAPSAVMGLVGGFATPLLVGDPDSGAVPLLTYLALLDIALFVVARRRGWAWLAVAAVLLSFGWAFSLTVAPVGDALAGGLFVVGLGIAASLVRPGPGRQLAFLRPVGIGLLQLALLVGRTDLGLPAWGLFGALALAAILLSSRPGL
jgi:uncharacterized membrane protein